MAEPARREQLGVLEPGATVALSLDQVVPLTRVRIEIDGQAVATPAGLRGSELLIVIPRDLTGISHDIVVFLDEAGRSEELGSWEFETAAGDWTVSGALRSEVGYRSAEGRSEDYASAAGRIDANMDEGRFSGRLTFALSERPDPATGDRLSIPDWFVESRLAIAGDLALLRAGSQYLATDGVLIDEGARRGISFGLADPGERYDARLFAVQPRQTDGTDNLLGLADADDRLVGVEGHVLPFAGASQTLGFAAYKGRAQRPGDAGPGDVEGAELALTGPVGTRADYLLSYGLSRWDDGGTEKEGTALISEVTLALLPAAESRSLGLTLGYDRIEQDFHAPLNPGLIAGEETLRTELAFASDIWTWSLQAAGARTNTGGSAANAVDQLGRLSFDASYSPAIFTGGFMNGTTFYFGAEMLTQDRQRSPAGAPAPTDHTIRRLSLGFDRFQPDHSLAVLYTHDVFDDRTGGGGDMTVQGVESLVTFIGLDGLTASAFGRVSHTDGDLGTYWGIETGASFSVDIVPDWLSYDVAAGYTRFENDARPRSGYVAQDIAIEVLDGHDLVVSAVYGFGDATPRLATDSGWTVGVALRSDLGFSSRR